jgi:hypothetical protein
MCLFQAWWKTTRPAVSLAEPAGAPLTSEFLFRRDFVIA